MRWRWIINSHQTAPPDGYATSVEWRHLRFDLINIKNNNHNTDWQQTMTVLSGFLQGYQDIVNEKVASAIAKLEEAGLTPEACEKFLKTYGKVIFNCSSNQHSPFCSGSPPKPRAHAGHQVFLPEHPGPQRRVGMHRRLFSWNLFSRCRCTMSQMTDIQLQTKENLARNFLEIARKILPGISRLKVALG